MTWRSSWSDESSRDQVRRPPQVASRSIFSVVTLTSDPFSTVRWSETKKPELVVDKVTLDGHFLDNEIDRDQRGRWLKALFLPQ
jgi:hypothetical protein